jgi:hypothetical protein
VAAIRLCRLAHPTLPRSFCSQGDSYYDSQSGRWMTMPGTHGVRVHDTSAVAWSALSMPQRYRRMVGLYAAGVSSVELWDGREAGATFPQWVSSCLCGLLAIGKRIKQLRVSVHQVGRRSRSWWRWRGG